MRAVVPVSVAMDPRAVAALVLVLLVRLAAAHDAEDLLAGCRTAANDLVFILDGSSSLGEPDFSAAKRWLADITAGFDVSQRHTQVAVVQYSDTPRLEVPLGGHQNGADLLDRIANITRLGGSTRTGRAITFALDHVFPSANRTGRSRNRMAVVLTDGRSQDDVVDAAMEAQAQNIALFAVGVGDEISNSELVAMASKPSSAYVLYVQDYPSIGSIHDAMQQRLCEASVCPLRITGSGGDVRGFDLLGLMGVDMVSKKVQGSLSTEGAYLLSPRADLTHNTREIFPEGLPPSYVFVATLRVKSPTNQMKFDLWRVLSLDGVKQVAVTLNGAEKSVIFTTGDSQQMEQYIIFNDRGIKRLFDTSWHQLKLLVKPKRVTCYLDGVRIEEQLLEPAGPIYINGRTQLAKKVNMETTVPIVLQKLRVYCDPLQSERETACEIHSVEDARCPADRAHVVPQACDCPSGKPGVTGLPGPMGFRGEKGREGPPGPDGKPGKPGDNGPPGEPGSKGHKGEAGTAGVKGERGLSGAKGDMGPQGPPGLPGPPAPAWPEYSRLKAEDLTVIGMKGERGDPGEQGQAGEPGPVGEPGIAGGDGPPGAVGPKGERGEVGMAGNDGQAGAPGIRGFPGEPGRMGPQGERGMQGATGIPGPRGPQGVQGPVGQVGPEGGAGPKGNSGLRGQDGLPGPTGPKGSVGEPGVQGLPGDRGPAGFKGHKGDAGDPGPKGNQGEKGIDGRPSAPGVPGLPGARGSRGERGPVGEAGSRGAVGHKGEAGAGGPPGPRGFPGQDGTQGQPGVPGYPGKPGKPPSEEQLMKICAAVLQTELPQLLPMLSSRGCRHCESVQGPPGEPGPPGPKGSGGAPGYPGNAGSQGYPGPPGRRGPQGIKGGVGPMGMKGSKGEGDIGLPGPSGPPGVEGPRGNDGEGYPGPPGPPGKAGSPGAPGTQGPMGPSGVCDPSSCYQPYNIRERHFGKGPPY